VHGVTAISSSSSEWLGFSREPAPLCIREAKPLAPELPSQRQVLGLQILDHLFLPATYPTDQ
jgi:hypothetical protein